MEETSDNKYYVTYETIYNYRDYTTYAIILFFILLLILFLSIIKEYN